MGIDKQSCSQNRIMIICEEEHTLRTLYDNKEPDADGRKTIGQHELMVMSLRSRYNPGQNFYIVDCAEFIRFGLDADDIFDVIYDRYKETNFQPLDELYEHIERIG